MPLLAALAAAGEDTAAEVGVVVVVVVVGVDIDGPEDEDGAGAVHSSMLKYTHEEL
jgi:hypothetical protein